MHAGPDIADAERALTLGSLGNPITVTKVGLMQMRSSDLIA
jgi:hypothetical protein